MPLLQQYSPQKRKRIALLATGVLGLLLLGVLVAVYTGPKTEPRDEAFSERIRAGYTTILEGAQSYFVEK